MSVPDEYIDTIKRRLRYSNLSINDKVLEAFKSVPRHYFVSGHSQRASYKDTPLPIDEGQTISAPHMYAMYLSEELTKPRPGMDILEIGTGSGYGAALIAYIVRPNTVYTIERHKRLVEFAKRNLEKAGIENVEVILGDGTLGIEGEKFDRILVTAAGPKIPKPLINQLKRDGRLIIPLEENYRQWLSVVTKNNGDIDIDRRFQVRFVKLIGDEGF